MANIDSKTRLNLKIGSAKHSLPLYDSYSDFYNGKYMRIKTFNKNLYAPLSPSRSELTVNAGVVMDGLRYYFLMKSFKQGEGFTSTGHWYKYISGGSANYGLAKVLSCSVTVPEDGLYTITSKVKWAGSYNDYHNYRRNSSYQFQTRFGNSILTDTGLLALSTDAFYPYSTGRAGESDMPGVIKWMTLGSGIEVQLKGGANTFDLWIRMYENNNKHAALYIDPFQVEVTYSGYKVFETIKSSKTWVCPANVKNVSYSLYGAGGGGGGTARSDYDDQDSVYHGVGVGGSGGRGELVSGTTSVTPGKSYSLVVGKGGTAGSNATREPEVAVSAGSGTAGGNTTAFGVTARGGGGGGGGYVSRESDDGWTWVEGHSGSNGTSYSGGSAGGSSGSVGTDGYILLRYNN